MGLARDLTMGPPKKRNRPGQHGDYATLRRYTEAKNPDPTAFREVLDRVAANPARKRYAEGMVYLRACERYRELTGEDYGPKLGRL